MSIKSILLVDDSEVDLFLHEMIIQSHDPDIKIYKAYDGKECLKILQETSPTPQITLLDINMPGMNGFEFLEKYSKDSNKPETHIVMLSSSIQVNDKEKAMAYECVRNYIAKPLTKEHIEQISKIL